MKEAAFAFLLTGRVTSETSADKLRRGSLVSSWTALPAESLLTPEGNLWLGDSSAECSNTHEPICCSRSDTYCRKILTNIHYATELAAVFRSSFSQSKKAKWLPAEGQGEAESSRAGGDVCLNTIMSCCTGYSMLCVYGATVPVTASMWEAEVSMSSSSTQSCVLEAQQTEFTQLFILQ